MEGKGLLLKTFADIDVFDIEVDETDPERFIDTVVAISKTFGGINLEDIKAPECFEIERRIAEATAFRDARRPARHGHILQPPDHACKFAEKPSKRSRGSSWPRGQRPFPREPRGVRRCT
ncbi:MAG: hypothetical protein CM15mP18_2280 [Methanobacteriota archaeon]|nr:MAG: hypothetical protein CM15mP18_2280 [Euryarchaeota archaeon]